MNGGRAGYGHEKQPPKCVRCGEPYEDHLPVERQGKNGPRQRRVCKDGSAYEGKLHIRASQSFVGPEVEVLGKILEYILRGQPVPTAIVRTKEFTSLAKKIASMKRRVARLKERANG